jgi:thiol:disulfide interchange protein DsbD
VLLAFAAWLYEAMRVSEHRWRRSGVGLSAVSCIGAAALIYLMDTDRPLRAVETPEAAGLGWLPFSTTKIDERQAQGRPVFVDFTADWCITCKLNERVALADRAVRQAFVDNGVTALRADWTRQDPTITRTLEANGRAGVPLYLFYPRPGPDGARRQAVILPQILTAETILQKIRVQ